MCSFVEKKGKKIEISEKVEESLLPEENTLIEFIYAILKLENFDLKSVEIQNRGKMIREIFLGLSILSKRNAIEQEFNVWRRCGRRTISVAKNAQKYDNKRGECELLYSNSIQSR